MEIPCFHRRGVKRGRGWLRTTRAYVRAGQELGGMEGRRKLEAWNIRSIAKLRQKCLLPALLSPSYVLQKQRKKRGFIDQRRGGWVSLRLVMFGGGVSAISLEFRIPTFVLSGIRICAFKKDLRISLVTSASSGFGNLSFIIMPETSRNSLGTFQARLVQ